MAERAYTIPIKFEIDTDEKDKESPEAEATPKNKEKDDKAVGKMIIVQAAKKAATWAVSGYGNLTGDYLGQTRINEAINLAALLGTAVSSPAGAAAAATSVALSAANYAIDLKKNEQDSAFLRERLGDISTRGGR